MGTETTEYLLLKINHIHLREKWRDNLDKGNDMKIPNMPISFGFRNANQFWFAKHKTPFWLPTPENKGSKHDAVMYIANRLDEDIAFTENACKELTGIPKVFLKKVLKGIVQEAKENGVSIINKAFIEEVNNKRK